MAELESSLISERVKAGMAAARVRGRRCFRAVDVLSSQSNRILIVSEERHDHPSPALPLLEIIRI